MLAIELQTTFFLTVGTLTSEESSHIGSRERGTPHPELKV